MTYKMQFKRHNVTTKGFQYISLTQQRFEELWSKLIEIDCSPYEKEKALDKLKEACAWFTRGVAAGHVEDPDSREVIEKPIKTKKRN